MRRDNSALRGLLAEARWTEDALARRVNVLAQEIGLATRLDRRSVSHWLAGRQPRSPLPDLITEALAQRLERQLSVAEAGRASAHAAQPGEVKEEPLGKL